MSATSATVSRTSAVAESLATEANQVQWKLPYTPRVDTRAAKPYPGMVRPPAEEYAGLHRLGELGRAVEDQRSPDPYPRPTGPPPSLQALRQRSDEINRAASHHGARNVRVFGSIVRGDHRPGSDVDLLVEMDSRSLLEQASLQGDLEDLLGCPVHVLTTTALRHIREDARERIEREAVPL